MWIFTKHGMISVVQKDDKMHVRSRSEATLEAIMPSAHVEHWPRADYPYRVLMTRQRWLRLANRLADEVDYDNFKAACKTIDKTTLLRVWTIMGGGR